MRSLTDDQKRAVTERFQVLRRWLTVGGPDAGETERAYISFMEACGDACRPLVDRYRQATSPQAVAEWVVEVEATLRADIEPAFWSAAARRELATGQMLDPGQKSPPRRPRRANWTDDFRPRRRSNGLNTGDAPVWRSMR